MSTRMEVDVALVRRTAAIGRAQVPGAAAPQPAPQPSIPHQGGGPAGVPGPPAAPGLGPEMAAAVPSKPANGWAVVAGLGLAGAGALGAWNINALFAPGVFEVGSDMSVFAALFVFAAAVERLLEPFSRWMPGRTEQERYEKAVADMDNGVPGATGAAAHFKAAVDQARAARGIIMWGLATGLATVLSSSGGFYLLRMINERPTTWSVVPTWVDALITGLVVGSGTKPLHDLINRMQRQATSTTTPV